MTDTGPFEALAEFGVALAGFTGVVVVFGLRRGELMPADRFRVYNALVLSLGGSLLAILPLGLQLAAVGTETVWRLSSLALAVVVAGHLGVMIQTVRRLSIGDREVLRPFVAYAIFSVLVLSPVLGALNASGVLFRPQGFAHFACVFCLLFAAAVIFVRIVFVRPPSGSMEA
ncbi:MAG: hypothetical protein ABFS41_15105 [Myxococcota bacterium]